MKNDDSAAIFARISNALARIDKVAHQPKPAVGDDAMTSLKARNAVLQAAATRALQDIDALIASVEKGAV